MDSVNIENQQGKLLKANVSFVRAPMVGHSGQPMESGNWRIAPLDEQ